MANESVFTKTGMTSSLNILVPANTAVNLVVPTSGAAVTTSSLTNNAVLGAAANAGTSAGSAGDATKCAAQKVIPVVIAGVTYYIAAFTQNT